MIAEPIAPSSSASCWNCYVGNAPAAIVLGRADAIVALGVLARR
jgi:predicted aconitase with swiveling domain